jgi:predicted DNA-binding transcriptional regulator AlpA
MRLLSKREAAAIVGCHPEHLMRLAREGGFPQPIKLGAKANCAVRFDQGEIDQWLTARKEARAAASYMK